MIAKNHDFIDKTRKQAHFHGQNPPTNVYSSKSVTYKNALIHIRYRYFCLHDHLLVISVRLKFALINGKNHNFIHKTKFCAIQEKRFCFRPITEFCRICAHPFFWLNIQTIFQGPRPRLGGVRFMDWMGWQIFSFKAVFMPSQPAAPESTK